MCDGFEFYKNVNLKTFLPDLGISYSASISGPQECDPTPRIARSSDTVTLSVFI